MSRPKFRGDLKKIRKQEYIFLIFLNPVFKGNFYSLKENLKYSLDSLYNFLLSLSN